jgi:hypothetical protein
MKVKFDYIPTKKQALFHASPAAEILYGGAAGGGKSYAMVWDALFRCLMFPRTHAYLFRKTYMELEQTLIQTACQIIPKSLGKYRGAQHRFDLVNGSALHFCHCQNEEKDVIKYQGAEIQWLYFDELTHFQESTYNYLKSRLRANKALGVTPMVHAASNPGGPGHAWVKARFVDRGEYGKIHVDEWYSNALKRTVKTTVQYIPALATDNPHIQDNYIAELEKKPEALRNALLYGSWDAFEGQVFTEWADKPEHYFDRRWTHVIEPFEIPEWWPRFISLDHGYTHPWSLGCWAVGDRGEVYRYKELYGWNGTRNKGAENSLEEIGIRIREFMEPERRAGIKVQGVADPAMWDGSKGLAPIHVITKECGIFFEKGDNARLAGKMQVHSRLAFDEDGQPMMQIFKNCTQFIATVPFLSYSLTKTEDIDTDGEDHIYDETRYFLMTRPYSAPKPAAKPRYAGHDPLGRW